MLLELRIKNLATIDEMEVTFGAGLNVITGETGAGKSIIIGALSLLLGERASANLIRNGAENLIVEGLFDITGIPSLHSKLREAGCGSDAELIIRRIVSRSGKNRIYIGGGAMLLTELAEITENLVAICSQHEHQVLLHPENHIDILDNFAGTMEERHRYASLFSELAKQRGEYNKMVLANEQSRQKEDFLRYQLEEIDKAKLVIGEDEALAAERMVLANTQKLAEHARRALTLLYLENGSVTEKLKTALADVKAIEKIDSRLEIAAKGLEDLFYQVEDIAASVRNYESSLVFSPERLTEVEERLELIKQLKRKHAGELVDIIAKREELAAEIEKIASLDEKIAMLDKQVMALEKEALALATLLSQKRKTAALELKAAIELEIASLKLAGAVFEVVFKEVNLDITGSDEVEFFLSTNMGEKPKPLSSIASGGELSRIVLALRSALAKADMVASIVFDEVDSGIGGVVASLVGEKIAKMAESRQVICITHLPQIACFANRHFAVSKEIRDGQTKTNIRELSKEESTEEVARMLSGKEMTTLTREHAREMLETAKRF